MRTYHGIAGDSLVAKSLKEKCIGTEVKPMIGNKEDLYEIRSTLDVPPKGP